MKRVRAVGRTARSFPPRAEVLILPRPRPRASAAMSVARALGLRRTTREVGSRPLSLQMTSDLLWAAAGVNRTRGPFGLSGRTAASASNSQEIDVYVAMQQGTYLYDPVRHALEPVAAEDLRRMAIGHGQSSLGDHAPLRLIYVADIDRLVHTQGFREPGLRDPAVQRSYYYVDTGLMAANVYLFAAAAGLAAWFHNCDRRGLAAGLKLRPGQRALFGQTVGHPGPASRR